MTILKAPARILALKYEITHPSDRVSPTKPKNPFLNAKRKQKLSQWKNVQLIHYHDLIFTKVPHLYVHYVGHNMNSGLGNG